MARIATRVGACALLLVVGCTGARKQAANPFRPAETVVRRDADRDRTAWERDELADSKSSTDPRTIDLIAREVPDATEAERRELADSLSGVDPATARKILKTFRMARGRGEPSRSAERIDPRASGVLLAGGHSQGAGDRLDPAVGFDDSPSRRPEPTVAARPIRPDAGADLAGLGVPPWSERTAADGPRGDSSQRHRWPDERPAAEPRPARNDPTGLGRFAERLTGVVRPAAAANARPNQPSVRGDVTLVGDTVPGDVDSRPVRELRADTDPDRPIVSVDVPTERTMGNAFDATPPRQLPTTTARDRIAQLVDDLDRSLADAKPGDDPAERLAFVEKHVLLRLLYLANDQQERAFVAIPGLDSDEQAFWKSYLWATANYFDAEGIEQPQDRAGQAITQLRDAIRSLQAKARLELRHVTFCEKISSFGNYEPVDGKEFAARKEILVYAEVENFRSEVKADGTFLTLLKSSAEIYDQNGELVGERVDFGPSEDRSRVHRRDFFLAFQFALPDMPPGTYRLNLAVEDQLSGRTDTHTLNFTVTR